MACDYVGDFVSSWVRPFNPTFKSCGAALTADQKNILAWAFRANRDWLTEHLGLRINRMLPKGGKPDFRFARDWHYFGEAIDFGPGVTIFGKPDYSQLYKAYTFLIDHDWPGGLGLGIPPADIHLHVDTGPARRWIETGKAPYSEIESVDPRFSQVLHDARKHFPEPDGTLVELQNGPPDWVKWTAAGAAAFYFRRELRTVANLGLSFLSKHPNRRK